MGTLSLVTIRNLIRSDLNESSTSLLSDTELNSLVNDGYKDVAVKGLCYELEVTFSNILAEKIIPLVFGTNRIIRVNYVEYKSGTTDGGWGMLAMLPQATGHTPAAFVNATNQTGTPQYWFQWGDYLKIDPIPDVTTYDLKVFASSYPTPALSADADLCADLPVEFHECVYLFALAFAALKLKRWGDAANAYNRYIMEVQRKRNEYVMKYPDGRFPHELPDNVTMEEPRGR